MINHTVVGTAVAGVALTVSGLLGTGTTPASAGTASHYTLTFAKDGSQSVVTRWAPCVKTQSGRIPQSIRYKVRTGGRRGRIHFVKQAVHKVEAATGLRFHYMGRTHYIPQQGVVDGYQELLAAQQERRTGAQLVIAWARQGKGKGSSNLLYNGVEGIGSIVWRYSYDSDLRISDAAVVLKKHTGLRRGFHGGESEGTLILHELGHAVGLQHVYDPSQVMNPMITSQAPNGYGRGDRSGLKRVGASAGCMHGPWLPATR